MDKDMIKEIYKEKLLYLRDLSNLNNIIWRLRISNLNDQYFEAVLTMYDALVPRIQERIKDRVQDLIKEYNNEVKKANERLEDMESLLTVKIAAEYRKGRLMKFYARKIHNLVLMVLDEFGLTLEPKTYLTDIEDRERDRFKKDFESEE